MWMDSELRCPRCAKRMMCQVGQAEDASPDGNVVVLRRHECWNCDYVELDTQSPRKPVVLAELEAVRRRREAAGEVVPMHYDRTPLTVEQALEQAP